jgi:putative copper resistance protein D
MLDAGLIASRFLHYAAVLSLFGGALFPLYVFRGRHSILSEADAALLAWLRRVLFLAVFLALISGLSWFVFTTASMAGDVSKVVNISVLQTMMLATDFGPLWAVRLVLTILIAGLLVRWPFRPALWLVPLLAALLLASLAGTGHARATQGWSGVVHIASDAAHLLAAGVWLGGLWPLGVVIAASLRINGRRQGDLAIGETLRRFSGFGTIAVAILVASGLVNTWFLVDTPSALIETTYGRLLVAKVALFVMLEPALTT